MQQNDLLAINFHIQNSQRSDNAKTSAKLRQYSLISVRLQDREFSLKKKIIG